jgi:YggT family protein
LFGGGTGSRRLFLVTFRQFFYTMDNAAPALLEVVFSPNHIHSGIMEIYIVQFINYTLSFFMWMIIGRAILTLISGGRTTFLTGLFAKITDPVYRITKKVLPFAKDTWLPFLAIVLIIVLRLLLIIVSSPSGAQQ